MSPEEQSTHGVAGGMFRRILVGFDGSEEAQRALRVALALAADLNGEVQVLLVIRPSAHTETPEERASATEAERENLSLGLADVKAQTQGSWDLTTHTVVADNPAKAIGEHAAMHGFDLVVVGGHGRERVTHGGIGRSVEELLRQHPCPVLVV
jgi:nucleotide-binding universal stress UspA family protein